MSGGYKPKYRITEEDVRLHAPVVFNAIQAYYERIERLVEALGNDLNIREAIHSNTNIFDILPNKNLKYDEIFLRNDEFKVSVVYHLCISNTLDTFLSWEAYMMMKSIFEHSFATISDESLSIDSIMLRSFEVDPAVLPKRYLTKTMRIDEFNLATELIVKEVSDTKGYEEFMDYNKYFDYMKEKCKIISDLCHSRGYYGTHDLDRFTCACIANRMRMPSMDLLYRVEGVRARVNITIDQIKEMQSQILDTVFGEEHDDI